VWLLFITILALVAIVLGNHENRHRVNDNRNRINDIQRERRRALILVCGQTNKQNRGIVAFIKSSVPPARRRSPQMLAYLARAEKAFPQTDCAAVVNRIIKQ